jgi:hypothetical protein
VESWLEPAAGRPQPAASSSNVDVQMPVVAFYGTVRCLFLRAAGRGLPSRPALLLFTTLLLVTKRLHPLRRIDIPIRPNGFDEVHLARL